MRFLTIRSWVRRRVWFVGVVDSSGHNSRSLVRWICDFDVFFERPLMVTFTSIASSKTGQLCLVLMHVLFGPLMNRSKNAV